MNLHNEIVKLKTVFDLHTDNGDVEGLKKSIFSAMELLDNPLISNMDMLSLNYSIATAYADIESLVFDNLSHPELEELQENYIYYYRAALDNIQSVSVDTNGLFQQLYTNAGNAYSRVGRVLEAMRLYDIASSKYGMFPMALGNKGIAAHKLSLFTYDPNHSHIFNHFAHFCLTEALKHREYLDLHGNAAKYFESIKMTIEQRYPPDFIENPLNLGDYTFGKTKKEQNYRKWATMETLFLNELNDIMTAPIVATDYLHLPSMIYTSETEQWKFHYGLFNQIKQEYVSARYLFYDGMQDRKSAQLADREVLQIEIDMDVHSHSDYSIRTAFRTLYSILDRIAFFMNEYFSLGIPLDRVSFRSIWNTKEGTTNPLLTLCENNDMLNAIYWLSKDVYEKNYRRTTKPASKEFDTIRNRMEHRYAVSTLEEIPTSDDYTYRISTVSLYEKTLELMQFIRETIIYLSFAIHIEESRKREKAKEQGKVIPQFQTTVMPDICK
ncbi:MULTISPECIES: LA2681 family HEPN domain-containing protein [unclassified Sedimentibacter]|uniref:LA2681 family HEPN domain-containing protein n=1 Tax=unclassified Sedimentibacter TaxID=2649220 RepID=UPI0027DEE2AB|nr:LA2681 family HEPN domain-containing protein [Sedimentibacter sp. MB35-C1]WMJ77900.1 LA2681 family HEPN domain-containing protein [Sedimentibacter sp. MB35-C1]